MQTSAAKMGIPRDSFTYLQCDLAAFESVRKFVDDFKATGRPLDALVCNAVRTLTSRQTARQLRPPSAVSQRPCIASQLWPHAAPPTLPWRAPPPAATWPRALWTPFTAAPRAVE